MWRKIVFTQTSLLPNYLLLINQCIIVAWMTGVFLKVVGPRTIFPNSISSYFTLWRHVQYPNQEITRIHLCMKYYLKTIVHTRFMFLETSSRLPYRRLASFSKPNIDGTFIQYNQQHTNQSIINSQVSLDLSKHKVNLAQHVKVKRSTSINRTTHMHVI